MNQPTSPQSALSSLKTIVKNWLNMPGFKRYFENVGWSVITKIAGLVVSFLATIYVVKSLGPTNYGLLSYAISYVSIFSFIATIGIDQVLYRELIRFPERSDELMGTSLILRLLAGSTAAVICIGSAYLTSANDISLLLISILSFAFIFNAPQVINYEFQARVESKRLSQLWFASYVIINFLKVTVIFLNGGVIYLAGVLLFEAILNASYLIWFRTKKYGSIFRWSFSGSAAKIILTDSWPMILATAFSIIYARIDQVFIKHLIDTTSVGLYDAAVRISEVWYFVPTTIVGTFFPALINAKKSSSDEYTKRLAQSALLLAGISIAVSIPVALFANQIIYILYGASFMPAVPVLQIYIWSSVSTALGSLATSYLIAENMRKALFISSCSTMVMNIILNIILIPKYGIAGSAWATFISYMAVPLSLLFFRLPRQQIYQIFRVKNVLHS